MNEYKLRLQTCYGDVVLPMQADNESAVNTIAEVMTDNHGDILDSEVFEVDTPVMAPDTVSLELTVEQASWLKGLMQNPIHTQYSAEDKTGRHMRKAIFKLL